MGVNNQFQSSRHHHEVEKELPNSLSLPSLYSPTMTQLPMSSNTPPAANKSSPDQLSQAFDYAQQLYELSSVTGATFLPKQWSENGYCESFHCTRVSLSPSELTLHPTNSEIVLKPNFNSLPRTNLSPRSQSTRQLKLSPSTQKRK